MTIAKKLRFLEERVKDEKPFLINDSIYVFDKNTLTTEEGYSNITTINQISFVDLKLKPHLEKEKKMTVAEKLRFLADRCEDEKPFIIDGSDYVFDKNTLCNDLCSSIITINALKIANLELKPQWVFTEDEKVILRNLPDEYCWIARDKADNGLYAYIVKIPKGNRIWLSGTVKTISLNGFNRLFQSIQWTDDDPCYFRKYI